VGGGIKRLSFNLGRVVGGGGGWGPLMTETNKQMIIRTQKMATVVRFGKPGAVEINRGGGNDKTHLIMKRSRPRGKGLFFEERALEGKKWERKNLSSGKGHKKKTETPNKKKERISCSSFWVTKKRGWPSKKESPIPENRCGVQSEAIKEKRKVCLGKEKKKKRSNGLSPKRGV